MTNCLFGVDGGGSKTAFHLTDLRGNYLAHAELGGCSLPHIGAEQFTEILLNGAKAVTEAAGVNPSDITSAAFGMPCYGEFKETDAQIIDLIHSAFDIPHIFIDNDVVIAHAGSLALQSGVHIVAGTGAIAVGRSGGRTARANGWHEEFTDEGSAYWLGLRTFACFAKQSDHRSGRGPLYDIIKKYFNMSDDFDIIEIYDRDYKNRRDKVAKLAIPLGEAALLGDADATELYDAAAKELALSVLGVRNALGLNGAPCPCSYSGGLFNAGELLLAPFEKYLNGEQIIINPPILDPVRGAVLLAAKNLGLNTDEITDNLKVWNPVETA